MANLNSIVISTLLLLLLMGTSYSAEIPMSKSTKNKAAEIFGNLPIVVSDKIRVKVQNTWTRNDGKRLLEGDTALIKFSYRDYLKTPPQLIGVFLDGNRDPLVAKISPGGSSLSRSRYARMQPIFHVTAYADDYCWKNYTALVVMKVNQQLLANSISFWTIVADCGGHN